VEAADIAAFVAAGASVAALAVSVYSVRHTTKQAAHLELAKWSRERLSEDVDEVLHVCRQLEYDLKFAEEDVPRPTLYTDEFHKKLVGLSHVAPPRLAAAAQQLQPAAQHAGIWLTAWADPPSYADPDSRDDHRKTLQAAREAFHKAAQAEMGMR